MVLGWRLLEYFLGRRKRELHGRDLAVDCWRVNILIKRLIDPGSVMVAELAALVAFRAGLGPGCEVLLPSIDHRLRIDLKRLAWHEKLVDFIHVGVRLFKFA